MISHIVVHIQSENSHWLYSLYLFILSLVQFNLVTMDDDTSTGSDFDSKEEYFLNYSDSETDFWAPRARYLLSQMFGMLLDASCSVSRRCFLGRSGSSRTFGGVTFCASGHDVVPTSSPASSFRASICLVAPGFNLAVVNFSDFRGGRQDGSCVVYRAGASALLELVDVLSCQHTLLKRKYSISQDKASSESRVWTS